MDAGPEVAIRRKRKVGLQPTGIENRQLRASGCILIENKQIVNE